MTDNTIPDGDLLAIYRCRDFGRVTVAKIHSEQLPPVHAAHALMSEAVAMLLGCDIEAARTATTDMLTHLVQQTAAEAAAQSVTPAAENVVPFSAAAPQA